MRYSVFIANKNNVSVDVLFVGLLVYHCFQFIRYCIFNPAR